MDKREHSVHMILWRSGDGLNYPVELVTKSFRKFEIEAKAGYYDGLSLTLSRGIEADPVLRKDAVEQSGIVPEVEHPVDDGCRHGDRLMYPIGSMGSAVRRYLGVGAGNGPRRIIGQGYSPECPAQLGRTVAPEYSGVESDAASAKQGSLDELTASVKRWIEDHEDEAWSDSVLDLVQGIARRAAITTASRSRAWRI